tara:strand:+ start:797 stop:1621 length:825 start_codon:yes stop_codon:yes gene_type:complete
MNFKLIINFFLITSSSISYCFIKPSYAATILNCNGEIPKKTTCLIKARSYDVDILRIDICKENPFPSFRSTPDFNGSKCLNLFKVNGVLNKINLDKNSKFNISDFEQNDQLGGQYRFLAMILKNKFTISGEYNTGELKYKTGSKGPKDIIIDKTNQKPSKFSEKLINWRGEKDKDNRYCKQGGTPSRCDLNYNGIKLTAIGLNKDYFETYGNKTKYIFYISEFPSPITINEKSTGYFDIKYIKNLEVYGDGRKIRSISIAPFLFKSFYYSDYSY